MIFLGIDFSWLVLTLKIVGFLLSLAFSTGIVFSLFGIRITREKKREKRENHFNIATDKLTQVEKRWVDIKSHFQSKNPTDWRMAIIDADTMLESLINSLGYIAPTLGEKLKLINSLNFPSIDAAWRVHKLRNTLAHQGTNYNLSEREAYQAFKTYEQIFYENGYLS